MSFYVKDPTTDKAVRELAKLKGTSMTEAIRQAVEKELQAERIKTRRERINALAEEFAKLPKSGLKADKAYFDWLSGDD
jgi:antitoxin VapB